ncbi:hypothetical protein HZS_1158 [Henneguya salminicola]|nr:hypothetical protein HZS_1158 [Henneguya salminicola]
MVVSKGRDRETLINILLNNFEQGSISEKIISCLFLIWIEVRLWGRLRRQRILFFYTAFK